MGNTPENSQEGVGGTDDGKGIDPKTPETSLGKPIAATVASVVEDDDGRLVAGGVTHCTD